MMKDYQIQRFHSTRLASADVFETGRKRHHITGLVELDVTESRRKIKALNKGQKVRISFNAWLVAVIATTVKRHETVAAYLSGKNKRMIFNDINVSFLVEKDMGESRVPIPLLILKANAESLQAITEKIKMAKESKLRADEVVLMQKASLAEKLYFHLPGFVRRRFWVWLLKHPRLAFKKMGNVAITSVGMMGKLQGWFIPISIHPLCFGIGSVIKKPVVVDDQIVIREMLQMSVLIDHDVVDGADMARFLTALTMNIEHGLLLDSK